MQAIIARVLEFSGPPTAEQRMLDNRVAAAKAKAFMLLRWALFLLVVDLVVVVSQR